MKEITMTFEDIKGKVLDLGHFGDTGNQRFKFDCAEFFKDKATKLATLNLVKPNGVAESSQLTLDGDMPVWDIGANETDTAGFGAYQITISDGENILSSPIGRYHVGGAVEGTTPPTPPTPPVSPAVMYVGLTYEDQNAVLSKTMREIVEAIDNGTLVYIKYEYDTEDYKELSMSPIEDYHIDKTDAHEHYVHCDGWGYFNAESLDDYPVNN